MLILPIKYVNIDTGEYQERDEKNSLSINRLLGIIRREVVLMTAYEIITIFIGIIALLISFGGLLIAILTYLGKRK